MCGFKVWHKAVYWGEMRVVSVYKKTSTSIYPQKSGFGEKHALKAARSSPGESFRCVSTTAASALVPEAIRAALSSSFYTSVHYARSISVFPAVWVKPLSFWRKIVIFSELLSALSGVLRSYKHCTKRPRLVSVQNCSMWWWKLVPQVM